MENSSILLDVINLTCSLEESVLNHCVSLAEAQQWLMNNPNEIEKFGINHGAERIRNEQMFISEVKNRPIRKSELNVQKMESSRCFMKEYKMHKNWNEECMKKLIILWDLYQQDRDGMLNQYVHSWNKSRHKLIEQNRLVPFNKGNIWTVDKSYRNNLDRYDNLMILTLLVSVMELLKIQTPANWPHTFANAIAGVDLKVRDLSAEKLYDEINQFYPTGVPTEFAERSITEKYHLLRKIPIRLQDLNV